MATRALAVGAAVGWLAIAGCQPPATGSTGRRAPPSQPFALVDLVGGWRWTLRTTEAGTTRIEDEQWRFRPMPNAPTRLIGRYVRTVEVRSDDRIPVQGNQRPWYRQRAVFDVTVDIAPDGFVIRETGHRAEAGPCDHGFRHLGNYTGQLAGQRLTLRWDGGSQTLWQIDNALATLPELPRPASPDLVGSWRWDASSYDDEGNVHDESEWWEITRRSDDRIDATYRRRVTVRSPDGATPIPCAGGPSWTFDDAYVLEGRREDEHWHLHERAAEPGDHPCLKPTPRRDLDEATAEQLGDNLVLEWRGKRRQVLYRPDDVLEPSAAPKPAVGER
ncbi:MAG: hypothetical protein ACTHU0_39415 [Kofleriaceae bacterium]